MSHPQLSSLQCLPTELLLDISKWMEPEDSLRFVQTCKSLAVLTDYKLFWIACAQHLRRRRKVHRLPPHLLDIKELRASVLHILKLDRKWSADQGMNPGPLNKIELDTTQIQPKALESKAVTWAWFLEDGAHILCVVEDILVQLWNIQSQRLVVAFQTQGRMIRASKYMDENYFVLATSVSDGPNRSLQIWKYEWAWTDVRELLSPAFAIPILDDSTFTFVTDDMAGFAYVDGSENSELSPLDNINFVVVNWRASILSNPIFCFTPLSIFGQDYAEQCKRDHFRMTRASAQILMHFESTLRVVAFSFSLATFTTLLQRGVEGRSHEKVRIKPTLKVRYELAANEGGGLPDNDWATWGDSCLWDGERVGLMSRSDKTLDGENKSIIALSVLDLPTEELVDADDGIENAVNRHDIPEIQTTFTRPVVYIKPDDQHFSLTPDPHVLVSQPKSTKSVVWALAPPEPPVSPDSDELPPRLPQIQRLVVAHFPSSDTTTDMKPLNRLELFEESNTQWGENTSEAPSTPTWYDFDVPLKPRGNITTIEMDGWLPIDDDAMDIDLDDAYGRVAFGMKSGKVVVLEFV